jgi:hypothetical protein
MGKQLRVAASCTKAEGRHWQVDRSDLDHTIRSCYHAFIYCRDWARPAGGRQCEENIMATERTTDGEAAEPSSAAPGTTLRESLEDADILLWYTTREGKQISEKAIEDIVRAQSLLGTGERNPEVEAQFWVAFRELATAARPASIDSILATYSYPHGNYGRSRRRFLSDAAVTKKWYTYASIFVLVCITLIQIYWFLWHHMAHRSRVEPGRTQHDSRLHA